MKTNFYILILIFLCFELNSQANTYYNYSNHNFSNFIFDNYPEVGKISAPVPNPVNDYANFYYNLPEEQNGEIAIFDFTGIKVKSVQIQAGQGEIQIATYDLKAGVYFACLIVEGKTLDSKKLIKK